MQVTSRIFYIYDATAATAAASSYSSRFCFDRSCARLKDRKGTGRIYLQSLGLTAEADFVAEKQDSRAFFPASLRECMCCGCYSLRCVREKSFESRVSCGDG